MFLETKKYNLKTYETTFHQTGKDFFFQTRLNTMKFETKKSRDTLLVEVPYICTIYADGNLTVSGIFKMVLISKLLSSYPVNYPEKIS